MVRARSLLGAWATLSLAMALPACVVSPPDRSVWACATDLECADGFVCGSRAGDPERVCVQACSQGADCGAGGLCLSNHACAEPCSFTTDGRPIDACAEGLSCGRLQYPFGSTPAGAGLCGRAATCTDDTDCEDEPSPSRCASSTVLELRGLSNLPCVPIEEESGCPSGWVATTRGCLPNCDQAAGEVACPPGMACLEGVAAPIGARESESVCFFGFYGAPCRDDTECLVGRCYEGPGGRRQCTERCDDIARVSGRPRGSACPTLVTNAGPLGAQLVFRCASDAPDAVCYASGGVGSGCRDASDCVEGLECREGLCTRGCFDDGDCILPDEGGNPLASGFCDLRLEPDARRCRRRIAQNTTCELDAECVTNLCLSALDFSEAPRCGRARAVGFPCARDVECASLRCGSGALPGLPLCAPR